MTNKLFSISSIAERKEQKIKNEWNELVKNSSKELVKKAELDLLSFNKVVKVVLAMDEIADSSKFKLLLPYDNVSKFNKYQHETAIKSPLLIKTYILSLKNGASIALEEKKCSVTYYKNAIIKISCMDAKAFKKLQDTI
jgi:hypothetical protein